MDPWPHQISGVQQFLAAGQRGVKRIVLASPTGGGKSLMMEMLIRDQLAQSKRVGLYTNRKMLLEQLSANLLEAGIYHGIRAAGYEDEREHPLQLSSIQTEHSKVVKRQQWQIHDADLVLVDEGHLHTNPQSQTIIDRHLAAGAVVGYVTATPIGMRPVAELLIQAGTTSQLRDCGALVLAHHFGPDEPDMKLLKGVREGEDLSENQQRKAMSRPGLFGRVWASFQAINPKARPTILFAPGVAESIWFAEQFTAKGVRAAHIDGTHVWVDGELHPTSEARRQEIMDDSRKGRCPVVCNRFVLREGIDMKWLAHAIFATVFGSIQTYLQAGGRLLRACAGLDHVTVQDHGGNWWRHGSLNANRLWSLDDTASMLYGLRAQRLREKKLTEPRRCPQCSRIITGRKCECGHVIPEGVKVSRPVVTVEGELKELTGDIFKPRRVCKQPNGPALWERMYCRAKSKKWNATFQQAMALFSLENFNQWPDRRWPLMPVDELDFFRLVSEVPRGRLIPKETPT